MLADNTEPEMVGTASDLEAHRLELQFCWSSVSPALPSLQLPAYTQPLAQTPFLCTLS